MCSSSSRRRWGRGRGDENRERRKRNIVSAYQQSQDHAMILSAAASDVDIARRSVSNRSGTHEIIERNLRTLQIATRNCDPPRQQSDALFPRRVGAGNVVFRARSNARTPRSRTHASAKCSQTVSNALTLSRLASSIESRLSCTRRALLFRDLTTNFVPSSRRCSSPSSREPPNARVRPIPTRRSTPYAAISLCASRFPLCRDYPAADSSFASRVVAHLPEPRNRFAEKTDVMYTSRAKRRD